MQDEESLEVCEVCGIEFDPELERGYAAGVEIMLCFECALARGGIYDEALGEWVVKPHERVPDSRPPT